MKQRISMKLKKLTSITLVLAMTLGMCTFIVPSSAADTSTLDGVSHQTGTWSELDNGYANTQTVSGHDMLKLSKEFYRGSVEYTVDGAWNRGDYGLMFCGTNIDQVGGRDFCVAADMSYYRICATMGINDRAVTLQLWDGTDYNKDGTLDINDMQTVATATNKYEGIDPKTFKVDVTANGTIMVYVDGTKYISYKPATLLQGNQIAFWANSTNVSGGTTVKFTDITTTAYKDINGFANKVGTWTTLDSGGISATGAYTQTALLNQTMAEGTVELDLSTTTNYTDGSYGILLCGTGLDTINTGDWNTQRTANTKFYEVTLYANVWGRAAASISIWTGSDYTPEDATPHTKLLAASTAPSGDDTALPKVSQTNDKFKVTVKDNVITAYINDTQLVSYTVTDSDILTGDQMALYYYTWNSSRNATFNSVTVTPENHVYKHIDEVPATETANGTKAHDYCLLCEKNYINDVAHTSFELVIHREVGTTTDPLYNGVQLTVDYKGAVFDFEKNYTLANGETFTTDGGGTYPTIIELAHQSNQSDNGKLIAIINGVTMSGTVTGSASALVVESTDKGVTWNALSRPNLDNSTQFAELKDSSTMGSMSTIYELSEQVGDMPAGTLIFAGCVVSDWDEDNGDSHIIVWKSTDCGETWEAFTEVASGGGANKGVWEPYMVCEGGKLYCFYSDDTGSASQDHVTTQRIVYKCYDGDSWGEAVTVAEREDGYHNSRIGMPQITKLGDGRYFLAYEEYTINDDRTTIYDGTIRYKVTNSASITDWETSTIEGTIICADFGRAPSCIWIPKGGQKGTLIVTSQSSSHDEYMYASYDYGTTWIKISNPISSEQITTTNDRVGYSASFCYGSDGTLYYMNSTNCSNFTGNTGDLDKQMMAIVKMSVSDMDAAVVGTTVTLGENIGVNFYMNLSDATLADTTAYMEFTLPNGGKKQIPVSEISAGTYGNYFTCNLAAKEMTYEIPARLVTKEGTYDYSYSVEEYLKAIIEAPTKYGDEAVALSKAMLNYGAAAQQMFDYETESLANRSLSSGDQTITMLDASVLQTYARQVENSVSGVTYKGTTTVWKDITYIRHYFEVEDGTDLTFKVGDEELELKSGGTHGSYVEIDGIFPSQMPTCFEVTVSSGTETQTIKYGVYSYIYAVLNAAEGTYADEVETAVCAAYYYSQAALAYAQQLTN